MQQDLIKFMTTHWELCLAFIVILLYWLTSEIIEFRSTVGINAAHLVHLMNRETTAIIDIRDADSFNKGHIIGATSFPEKTIFDNINQLKKHQSKYTVLIDTNGSVSNKIINKFIAQGFEKAHYLKGGLQAWRNEKLPLETLSKKGKK
jgi:rhodanese-related sulfurtransferase